ncbi:hypothetical protein [Microbacterium flavum]|uniref:hypothetical protein n=1 Tax=Microbacterium flavum TaxID=415216 RepID=UPI0024AD5652|nr:hypothetical protein [Microbacterium flavum]
MDKEQSNPAARTRPLFSKRAADAGRRVSLVAAPLAVVIFWLLILMSTAFVSTTAWWGAASVAGLVVAIAGIALGTRVMVHEYPAVWTTRLAVVLNSVVALGMLCVAGFVAYILSS